MRKSWRKATLADLVALQRGHDLPTQVRDVGIVPVIGAGGPNGYHSAANVSAPGVVVGRSGSGFGNVWWSDVPFWAHNTGLYVTDFKGNDQRFVYYQLSALNFASYNSGGLQPSLNRNFIYPIELCIPPLEEQRGIAGILRTWDDALEKTERLLSVKAAAFSWVASTLLTGRRRLGGRRTNWPSVALTEVTREATARNGKTQFDVDVVMGVNKLHGMIPMKDHVRAADLSRYKIVRPGAFAYNPMRLNIGSIAQNLHGRDVLVSPDYVAFEIRPDSLLPAYFDHLRRTPMWSRFVKTAGSGGVRVRIYYDDLADFILELPPLDEQARIIEVLDTGRREIAILERQRDALAKQKRGLMQKLLTGEWTVKVPESQEAAE
ncbi:type I restriction enzyme S subunit [Rhodopseudomonas thermotolerans]|uniref:Type I restriction enzyme S subunit n=2 Tax=Rhodopseudomonas TaxID=1073 RepID=A0A336JYZ7_9BRAD|nr:MULTISPECIES: restriction endonuclease subunit S [Rhodopseudomonas]RED21563.1 type I restriction enzyme S subunit [Rhodopseudomonas pentothenatexigens]REF87291.1 type I restriction enzyme S subunit [Rhodopseudomonas thermotolerans]SSW93646.1 type I restriction enzyme S subunit [Rhodopseudomonas pentothenatexigens]